MTPLKKGIFIEKYYIYPILATMLSTFEMFHKRLLSNRTTCCSKCIGNTRSGITHGGATCQYGHASMLLLGEGSEATEPYNKHANLFK